MGGFQFQVPFDATRVSPEQFPQPPVLDDYHVRIVDAEAKPTTAGDGGYLELTLEILDPGPYQGRKIPNRLNIFNKSPQTCEIAYKQLSAICHVCRVFQVQDARQLFGIGFIATIGPQKDNPQYANVFQVKDNNGNIPGKAPAVASAPPAQAPAPAPAQPPQGWPQAPVAPPAAAAPYYGPPAVAAPPVQQQPAYAQPPAPAAPWGASPQAAPAAAPAPWTPGGAAPPAKAPWER